MGMSEKDTESLIVAGFEFVNPKDAQTASAELEKIQLLEEKMDHKHYEKMIMVYNKAIVNNVFITPVGIRYLVKLQEELMEHYKGEQVILPIPVLSLNKQSEKEIVPEQNQEIEKNIPKITVNAGKTKEIKKKYEMSRMLNIVLVVLILILFAITLTGENANIINYRYALENKYAQWDQELDAREQAVTKKEAELLQQEK